MSLEIEPALSAMHAVFRGVTGKKLVGDLHEQPTFGLYPPLDPKLVRRLARIREAGVLFIHIPKNAGMSVNSILYGEQIFHPTIRYYCRVAPDIVRDLPSFAIWRDPVERFVSAYCYAKAGGGPTSRVSRAFRDRYMAFEDFDAALTHVETTPSLYDLDHIFRPQFWYVANMSGRIAVDQICLIDDLDRAAEQAALPGLREIARINPSSPPEFMPTDEQLHRLRMFYAIDFAIYDALRSERLPMVLNERKLAA